ncbi:MAG: ribosome silencing factor [Candidatus Brocadiia bacterium]
MEPTPEALACTCAHLADERKAEAIVVLNVGKTAFFTDYFVIATGRNERQIKAIAEQVRLRVKRMDHPLIGTEGSAESGWVLIDLGDVIVHLFNPETRELYDLELLWGEAPRLPWQDREPLEDAADTGDRVG